MKKVLVTLGFVIVLVLVGVIGTFMYFTENMCANEIFKEVKSPDQEFKAVIFQRDCGATTGFSTQVSVLSGTESLPNESGNILIIGGHPNDTQLEINWSSDIELQIFGNSIGSEFKAEKSIELDRKVEVIYSKDKS